MDLNIGSKETELLIKLLKEFENGPYCLSALVQELIQKGYCKNQQTAYRYANRVLTIEQIFQSRAASKQLRKEAEETVQGLPYSDRINGIIQNPGLGREEKLLRCYDEINDLWKNVKRRLNYEPEEMRATYKKLHEHGLI